MRINTVAMAGVNEDEFDTLIAWCGEIGADLCLIETMPMGETGEDRTDHYLPLSTVRRRQAELGAGAAGLPHRRPGALRSHWPDRPAHRLHHAHDP